MIAKFKNKLRKIEAENWQKLETSSHNSKLTSFNKKERNFSNFKGDGVKATFSILRFGKVTSKTIWSFCNPYLT